MYILSTLQDAKSPLSSHKKSSVLTQSLLSSHKVLCPHKKSSVQKVLCPHTKSFVQKVLCPHTKSPAQKVLCPHTKSPAQKVLCPHKKVLNENSALTAECTEGGRHLLHIYKHNHPEQGLTKA